MYPAHNLGSMKKLKFLFFPTILALAFGLMLSCSNTDDTSTATDDTSTSTAITVSGKVQKGPYVQGTEITVRELDSSMIPTGNTFTGTIDDNTGSFSIKGTLANKIAELAADGYYFNEVSGALSTSKLSLQAFSDLTDSSSVNVNLMTHLEKKRVEYLMDNSKMTFAAAKTQAQAEIMKIFNIDNVTLGNSETLDISKSGDGNAVLLAISAILQSDKTEAELTELLSTINTDIRTDGTLDSTTTKATLVTAMDYLKSRRSTIRSNIESRYSNLGISATIPAFESYAFKLDITAPTLAASTTNDTDNGTVVIDGGTSPYDNETFVSVNTGVSITFSEEIDNSTVTINTTDTTCSGSIQLSADNFSSCVKLSSNMTISGDSVTINPNDNLSQSTTYKIKVTTQVTDLNSNPIASDYIHTSGFTTWQKASNILIRHPNSESSCSSGGGTTSAKYFAYPFSVGSSSINAKFFGLNLSTTSGLNKISIYNISSNSPGSSLYSTTNVNFDYFDEVYNLTCSSSGYLAQAYFENGISLSANTNYYIIFEYSSAVSNTINTKTGSVSLPVKRKYSNDLTNWSDWSGNVNSRYPTDSGIFFIAN
jgi:hypothetical protein